MTSPTSIIFLLWQAYTSVRHLVLPCHWTQRTHQGGGVNPKAIKADHCWDAVKA